MIRNLGIGDWRQPNMNWLVPMIAELTTTRERMAAITLLSRIDTPEAYALAEKWTTDPESPLAQAAAEQVKIRDQRATQAQEQLAQRADLLAGRIKPDDLLAATTPYTWNGVEYIPAPAPQ